MLKDGIDPGIAYKQDNIILPYEYKHNNMDYFININ